MEPRSAASRRQKWHGRGTRTFSGYSQHPTGEAVAAAAAAAAAAAVLHPGTEVGICVGCLAPPRNARGLARDDRREESTVGISPGLPGEYTDPNARGYGCARESLCAARRGEGAGPREAPCAARGRRCRTAGVLDDLWAAPIAWPTCGGQSSLERGLGLGLMFFRPSSNLCNSFS